MWFSDACALIALDTYSLYNKPAWIWHCVATPWAGPLFWPSPTVQYRYSLRLWSLTRTLMQIWWSIYSLTQSRKRTIPTTIAVLIGGFPKLTNWSHHLLYSSLYRCVWKLYQFSTLYMPDGQRGPIARAVHKGYVQSRSKPKPTNSMSLKLYRGLEIQVRLSHLFSLTVNL